MPQQHRRAASRVDPRGPLVLNTRALSRSPGSRHTQHFTAPAPADLSAGMVGVPEGAELTLDVQLEAVTEGVLVTAEVTAPLTGECARCLDPLSQSADVQFQELFNYEQDSGAADEDGYSLDGDLLDLEPVLRDALVLALPLAPLCQDDCPGLCPECGVQLARAGTEHGHAAPIDPRWAELARHMTDAPAGGSAAPGTRPDVRQPDVRQESGRGRP